MIGTSFLTSLLTACLGAGGGILLLGIMAQIVPPQAIIPLHGMVQLGSNANRAAMLWRDIDRQMVVAFLPGAAVGALLGSLVLISLPSDFLYLSIASFIVYLCWGPALPKIVMGRRGTLLMGAVTTFLTLFVGATGPLIGAYLKQLYQQRFTIVATLAAVMSVQHVIKILVFQQAGFSLVPWLSLAGAMIASGAIGTWVGLRILKHMPERRFAHIFNWVLTLLAARLVWQALSG
ncbi:sulfite exporter TauE/SafE family protein [Vreelandella subterranea]|uniref:sulfite exporter TauE/SafE family protein n=1 Tax=Vreelandella subterranea TaxID=416874 RepID=UPI001FE08A06|nr:sulfite exporter TauE/SafE family protein [Halomonas subterranea]